MLMLGCLSVNDKNHLTIGGVDVLTLAHEYGTPLYVMDEKTIRYACRMYKDIMNEFYGEKCLPLFAGKAMTCLEVFRIINQEGLGLDVVSGGELHTAINVGFPAEKIHFHGNNKTMPEINMALDYGVGRIVADNFEELEILSDCAVSRGIKVNVSLRIKPGVEAHTHDFIKTGQIDSKFGFAISNGEAIKAIRFSLNLKGIILKGIHCHIGSQIIDTGPFIHAAKIMMDFINQIRLDTGIVLDELNLGGGFGIKYTEKDTKIDYKDSIKKVSEVVKYKSKKYGIPVPFVYIEPGRSIVGESGITLYKVGGVKDIPQVRTYVSVDGGMTDNPRYALYQSDYTVINASKVKDASLKKVTVAGKCCESGDIIQKDVDIADPCRGDILAILCTGAYNYSMSSNYNRIPKAAVVMVDSGKSRIIVKRQTFDDIIKNDI